MYTHRGAYLNALAESLHAGLGTRSVYLWTLPMFHCNGWCFTWAVTAAGGTHVCLRKVDPPLVWRLIDEEGVTHLNGAPTVLVMLAEDAAAKQLERPVLVTTAGAPPPPAVIEREQMRDVPADGETMGEIVMRGNNVMKGYFDDEKATAEAFRGGWFHSGDLGVMHPDGYVQVRDRAKDIIISGGENISTIEVEGALVRHPDVLEAAVVAIPDEKWGERPKGFVAVRPGATLTEAELIAFTRETLPGFKAPSEIEFGELPKTSTGKVKKYELRERERQRRSSQVPS